MRGFRVPLFEELERLDWWWGASVLDRMVFLQLFRRACESGNGEVWVGGGALSVWLGPGADGEKYGHDEIIASYERLLRAGALEDVSDKTERWHYRIVGFQALADAAHTYRSKARESFRRWREKRGATA